MVNTEGRSLLLAYFEKKASMTQAELARTIGISEPSVHAWRKGKARPAPHFRKALCRLVGIREAAWMTPRERKLADGRAA